MTLRWLVGGTLAFVCVLGGAESAPAQGHQARVSRDLQAWLDGNPDGTARVVIDGGATTRNRLKAKHRLTAVKAQRYTSVYDLTANDIRRVRRDAAIDHLALDTPVGSAMATSIVATGAGQVWTGVDGLPGADGRGIVVAVVDSGVGRHPDLKKRVLASVDFALRSGGGEDKYGHGTHVAGAVTGLAVPGKTGVPAWTSGMAPGASLLSLRVLQDDGAGYTSDVIAALDWAVENRERFKIRVINLSLGHPVFESYLDDPLCHAVARAFLAGIVVVASAGNNGVADDGTPIVGAISSPGNSPYALTVGALNTRRTPVRSDDVMATYSSRGPTPIDLLVKPDLVAPGNRIVSLAAAGSYLSRNYPDLIRGGTGAASYLELSGSSMATGVASGAVALLLQAHPQLDPERVRLALQLSASAVPGAGAIDAGAGSLNVLAAHLLLSRPGDGLPATLIAGEPVFADGLAWFEPVSGLLQSTTAGAQTLVVLEDPLAVDWTPGTRPAWPATSSRLWADARRIVWGDLSELVWDESRRIVWGDLNDAVWGDLSRIVWGDGYLQVFDERARIVWGDTVIRGDQDDQP